jgi:hypothetical protein
VVENRDDALAKKVNLVKYFANGFMIIVVFVAGCGFTSWALEAWPITSAAFLESGVCGVVILEMALFLFRRRYEGETPDVDASAPVMRLLEEPGGSQITMMSSPGSL